MQIIVKALRTLSFWATQAKARNSEPSVFLYLFMPNTMFTYKERFSVLDQEFIAEYNIVIAICIPAIIS